MSKSRARFLAELLNSSGLVRESRSALAGADGIVDLDNLPTITNAKLENSSISIAGHSTALGGSVSLDTADISEHTDYPYFTNARARSAISVSGSLSYNSTTGVISYTQPTNISTFTNDSGYLTSHQSLAAYSTLASPTFTGTPAAPTATAGTNTTQIATTAFVTTAVDNIVDAAPGTLNTLNELAAALGDDANFSTTVTNSIATKLPLAGGTLTGDLNFGDSDAAIFGAGSDLQIYHDGSNSYIYEAGTGDLVVQTNGTKIGMAKASPFEWMLEANVDGAVTLYYDNASKLATTSTGIDVTGGIAATDDSTFTAASGSIYVTASTLSGAARSGFRVDETSNNGFEMAHDNADNAFFISRRSGSSTVVDALKIDRSTGDFSLFEDTGTTAKLFWDASAERLGLGTTSPARDLHIVQNDDWAQIRLEGNSSGGAEIMMGDSTTESKGRIQYVNASNYMRFDTNATERMRIDSSGNVGIGTTSPNVHGWTKAVSLDASTSAGYELNKSGVKTGAFAMQGDGRVQMINFTANPLTFNTNGSERMRIDSSGRVGIGATSLSNKLTVNGDQVLLANGELKFADATNNQVSTIRNSGGASTSQLEFLTASTERLRITSGGNAIFTKAGGAYLQLKDASAVRGSINVTTSDGLVFTTGASFTERMSINSSGAITFNQAYTFPTSDGTSGQVITTDGSGNLSFSTVSGAGASDVVNDTSPQLGGNLDTNGNDILFADNDKAIFGAGSDLQIWHSGTNSFISDNGAGNLYVGTNGAGINLTKGAGGESMATFTVDGAVTLYYDNTARLATTSTGIAVTGNVVSTGLTGSSIIQAVGADSNGFADVEIKSTGTTGASRLFFSDTAAQSGFIKYSHSGNSMEFGTGGAQRFTIDSSGNVGIGTSSTLFDVLTVDDTNPKISMRDSGTERAFFEVDSSDNFVINNKSASAMILETSDTERMRIDSSGKVGFNNDSPDAQVDISATTAQTHLKLTNSTAEAAASTNYNVNFTADYSEEQFTIFSGDTYRGRAWIGFDDYGREITFGSGASGAQRMVIDIDGNVGINNTAPDTNLHIGNISATNATGQGQIKLEASNANLAANGGLEFVTSPFGSGYGWKMNAIDPGGGVHLVFGTRQNATAWSEKMRILASGNVGIGTASPSRPLHVAGIAKADAGFEVGNSYFYESATDSVALRLGSDGPYLEFIDAGGSVAEMGNASGALALTAAGAEKVRITSAGNVGINKTDPSAKFHVSGTARFDHSESQGFRTVVTDNIGDRTFYGHHLDVNMSGSDTLTTDRPHYGLYLDVDSSATGGDTSNEHRVYGLYSDVRLSADSDLAYGSYSIARSAHTSGTVSTLVGAQNYGFANNSAGKTVNTYGAYNFGRSSVTGTGEIDNLYGSFNAALSYQTSTDTGTVCYGSYNLVQYTSSHNVNANQARGVYAEVQIDATSNTWTLSNAYVVRAEFDNNDSGNRTNNGYLFYGNYSGTTPTNAWGLYITNAAKNSISGNVGIGTTGAPSGRVHANGDAYTAFIADGTSGGAFKFFKNGSQHAQIFSDGSGDIVFRNHTDSERLRITSTGINVTGANTINGMLTVGGTSVSSSEGGEIRFTQATSNNLSGSEVALDQAGDSIRFFETTGSTRGAYLDINTCQAGATSKIYHSGNDGSGSGLDADTLDGIDSPRFVYGSGSRKTNNADPSSDSAMNSGFYDIYQTNTPTATWYSYITMAHNNTANEHGHQIAGSFYSAGDLYNRSYSGTNASFSSWTKIWNAANDGSGSGLDADTLDGYHSGETGASVNLRTGSNGYLYLDNWLRTGNTTGMYTADGAYFYRGGAYWNSRGNSSTQTGTQYQTSEGTTRGYVYANNSNEIGFLDNAGSWAVRYTSTGTYLGATQDVRINSSALTAMFESDSQDMVFRQKGSGSITWQFTSSGTNRMQLSSAGSLTCEGNISAYGSLSDIRLKENIKVIPNAVDKVAQLKGITFDYKKTKSSSTGVIAQDLQKVLPEAVYDAENLDDDDEKYLAVNYGVMAGLFVEAIKELKQEINELKAQLKEK